MKSLVTINGQNVEFEVQDGHVFATSYGVSEVFNKEHKNIIAKIDNFSDDVKHRLNFKPISIFDSYSREQRAYELNRDAFSFLVMGFTGAKADKWKLLSINLKLNNPKLSQNQFTLQAISQMANEMLEIETKVQVTNERLDLLESSSAFSASDCFRYQKAVEQKVWELIRNHNLDPNEYRGKLYASIHSAVKKRYEVASYKDLPHYKLDEVLDDMQNIVLKINVEA